MKNKKELSTEELSKLVELYDILKPFKNILKEFEKESIEKIYYEMGEIIIIYKGIEFSLKVKK